MNRDDIMTVQELTDVNLTAAIKAGTDAVHELGCVESMNGLTCPHAHNVADELQAHAAIEAALPHIREALTREALLDAADKWGEGDWQDAFLAAHVCDDVSAVQATVQWLRARADALDGGTP